MTKATLEVRKLRPSDLVRLATVGLRTRKLRASLSALGIAIGVAAIVAVLGLSSSASAGLLNEISALGTNLLSAAITLQRVPPRITPGFTVIPRLTSVKPAMISIWRASSTTALDPLSKSTPA